MKPMTSWEKFAAMVAALGLGDPEKMVRDASRGWRGLKKKPRRRWPVARGAGTLAEYDRQMSQYLRGAGERPVRRVERA